MEIRRSIPARRLAAGAMLLLLLALLPASTISAAGPPGTIYVVRYGDTLTSIAARFGVSLQALLQANGYASAPRTLYVGTYMQMPSRTPGMYGMPGGNGYPMSPYAGPAAAPTGYGAGRYVLYRVRFGDTLTRIALRYHTSVIALMIANNLPNPNLIYAGTRLIIPMGPGYAPSNPSGAPSYSPAAPGYSSATPRPMNTPSAASTPAPTTAPAGATTASVSLRNTSYNPKTITVRVGTQITWTNSESAGIPHTVTSGAPNAPNGTFDSGTLNPGQTFQFTFNTPGTFAYYCRIHGAAMTGTVTVTP